MLARLLSLIMLMGLAASISAQEEPVRYVNDLIHINLRVAPQAGAESIIVIPSGTRMVVLERDDERGYSRVRLDSGEEGWVRHQFLTAEPIARERLEAAEAAKTQMLAERDRVVAEAAALATRRDELDGLVDSLKQENARLQDELSEIREISAEAIAISERAREFQTQAQSERERREQAESAAASAQARLIMIGGIAGGAGLAIGFYIGSIPVRREKRWAKVD